MFLLQHLQCTLSNEHPSRKSWLILRDLYPKMDRFILNSVRNYFIEKDHNAPALASMPDAVAGTKRAQTLDEFMQAAVPFAGCSSMGWINSVRFKCSSFIF